MSESRVTSHESRVGIGYDSHRFAPGGPHDPRRHHDPGDFSLAGHSDGDAMAHALTDAVLGAAALGDIGEMFPDTDPDLRGAQLDRDAPGGRDARARSRISRRQRRRRRRRGNAEDRTVSPRDARRSSPRSSASPWPT